MNDLFAILFFLSLLCTPIFLILLLIRRFRKIPAGKYKKATIASAAIVVVSFIGFGLTMDPAPQIEFIELSIPDHQTEYDINTEIPVNISVLPEDADTSSLEYIVDNGSLTFSETGIITGSAEGTYEVHIKSGDVESNALTISVVDIAAREEEQRLAEEKRLAEERAAKEAEEKRLAEEQAAKEAEEKRLAEEQAAKEAEEKRLAEEQAAKEAEEKRLAEERAAREAEEKRLAEEKAAQSGSTSSGTSSEPPAAASSSSTLVWVDDTAKRYHRKNGCGMDNAYQVTLEEAIAMGKTPCGRCY